MSGILAASGIATNKGKAWKDEDDEGANKLKPFQTSDALPAWAKPQGGQGKSSSSSQTPKGDAKGKKKLDAMKKATTQKKRGKRDRDNKDEDEEELDGDLVEDAGAVAGNVAEVEDEVEEEEGTGEDFLSNKMLGEILRSTVPVLHSKHQRKELLAPKVACLIAVKQDSVKAMQWHQSGEVLAVAGGSNVHLHHVGGNYHEKLYSWPVKCTLQGKEGKRGHSIAEARLVSGHDSMLIRCDEVYVPQLMDLATGNVTVCSFLDPRQGSAYRVTARGKSGKERFIDSFAPNPMQDSAQRVAVACGQTITISSLSQGTVSNKIMVNDDVVSMAWNGGFDLYASAGNRVYLYDTRNTARAVSNFVDQGALKVTTLALSSNGKYVAAGSTSGVVNCYRHGKYDAPLKSFMNLSTSIDNVQFGSWGNNSTSEDSSVGSGDSRDVLMFSSATEHNGLRCAKLPQATVIPSFPNAGMKHTYITQACFNPKAAVLSVGEHGRITNYNM